MIRLPKPLRTISCLLATLLVFQSCVIYKSKPSAIGEAAALKENVPIKIITNDDHVYKVKWVEEKEGHILSILNTKRIFIEKSNIETYRINNPDLITVPLATALNFDGVVYIGMKNKEERLMHMEDRGDYIRGLKETKKDTVRVVIPIEHVKAIKMQSKGWSIGVPILSVFTFFIVVIGTADWGS